MGQIEIRSNLGQPNKVDSQFPVSPGPKIIIQELQPTVG